MNPIPAFFGSFWFAFFMTMCANSSAKQFHFDWPVPTTLLVTAKINNFGETSTARYRIDLVSVDSNELEVRFSNFSFVSLDGIDADDEQYAPTVNALESVTSSLPLSLIHI